MSRQALVYKYKKDEMDVKAFLAGLLAGRVSASLKHDFKAKVERALVDGAPLKIMSVDLEALPLGDMRYNPDAVTVCVGVQLWTISKWKFAAGPIKQYILDGMDAVELLNYVHEECAKANADAIAGHFAKYDLDLLRNIEPILKSRFGRFNPLPAAYIDIMAPFQGRGISAGQGHLGEHYEFGPEKVSVNMETWRHAVVGEALGMSRHEVLQLRHKIRDERNRKCMEANLAQVIFLSKNIEYMNRISITETYPNRQKMEVLLRRQEVRQE
jgi:hypothetical protein